MCTVNVSVYPGMCTGTVSVSAGTCKGTLSVSAGMCKCTISVYPGIGCVWVLLSMCTVCVCVQLLHLCN